MVNRMAYRNWMWESGVVITASASATGYPVSNLASSAPWKIWRSSVTTGDQWVKFDLGASRAMTGCLLRNALIHVGGAIKFQAHATDAWGAPTVNQTITVPATTRTNVLAAFIATQTLRWVRILFVNTTAVSQAVELGIAFPTNYLQMTRGIVDGVGFTRPDLSLVVQSISGHEQVDRRAQRYVLSIDPNHFLPADRDNLLAVYDRVGTHTPWFFVLDATDPNLMAYGKFVAQLGLVHATDELWRAPYVFQEEL